MVMAFLLKKPSSFETRYWNSNSWDSLVRINSLDTLTLLGDRDTFSSAVQWVSTNVQFNIKASSFANLTARDGEKPRRKRFVARCQMRKEICQSLAMW
ncbi:hypothetical protein FCM35_KLT10454 [Carex littledalei]|uniref:Uncharacterized protein n=1 Tax=Carex littledalei TaxID=544730 RepID=A0A833QLL4_9POAL|nr:hypothetical protein FCM35_KLT10454 [Carex littledalei]